MAENVKNEYIEIFTKNIKRDGADKLLEWLQTTDFFAAPASTKFHSNYAGGLCEHSIKVYKRLKKIVADEGDRVWADKKSKQNNEESLAIIGLLHDICKTDTYKTEMRNVKENGEWVQKPYYTTDDKLPYGHGEKSVYIISGFMKLTREEAMAINWHMGPFDARYSNSSWLLSNAYQMYPVAFLTFMADMGSTYLDEEIK
ncbi:MAG: HD domain-containing protein [Christensenellaceae bacterium]|nr:HD domain-containing protein [Christensenellaceae bacterium]